MGRRSGHLTGHQGPQLFFYLNELGALVPEQGGEHAAGEPVAGDIPGHGRLDGKDLDAP